MIASGIVLTLAAGGALAATSSSPTALPSAHRVTAVRGNDGAPVGWLASLSAGAPPGALTLGPAPMHVAVPAPADPATISALALDGIPAVALNAYRVAAARIDQSLPGCGIDWSLVAAIGRVESDHGQFGGATLHPDGSSTPKIIGVALDGQGVAYIHDTDHGFYDADVVYDRAVGPLQFIPSTWTSYAVDANGDGVASPFDIHDAALAAAHYLCLAGGDLHSLAGQRKAILAYNYSDAYLAEVLALARSYATGTPLTAPLEGSIALPVPAPTGDFTAPAAPGPAPAAQPGPGGSAARPRASARPTSAAHRPVVQPAPAAPTTAGTPTPSPLTTGSVATPATPMPVPTIVAPPPTLAPASTSTLSPSATSAPGPALTCGPLQPLCLLGG